METATHHVRKKTRFTGPLVDTSVFWVRISDILARATEFAIAAGRGRKLTLDATGLVLSIRCLDA